MVDQAIYKLKKILNILKDDTFGLNIPVQIDSIPTTILNPINAWNNKDNYKAQAYDLIQHALIITLKNSARKLNILPTKVHLNQ